MRKRPAKSKRRMTAAIAMLATTALLLLAVIVLGDRGLGRFMELNRSLDSRSQEIYRRIADNRSLVERIEGLRDDPRRLDEISRSKLGLVGEGEIVYLFDSHTPGQPATSNR
ncbi:MAG: septum formation initiator family protein [Deltaproteobacteria bacterium]